MVTALTAGDVAATSFALVDAAWPVARARTIVEQLQPTHVICSRQDPDVPLFALYSFDEFDVRLRSTDDDVSVDAWLDLSAVGRTPAVDADASAVGLPSRCVVHRHGDPVGFVDVPRRRTRGPWRGGRGGVPSGDTTTGDGDAVSQHALVAELPEHLTLQRATPLLVHLSQTKDDDARRGHLPVTAPAGTTMHVVVQAKMGVSVRGRIEQQLTVPEEGDSLPVRFEIVGEALGPARADVLAFVESQCVGAIKLRFEVVEATETEPPQAALDTPLAPAIVRYPDLTLLILEGTAVNGKRSYNILVHAPSLGFTYHKYGPIPLERDPQDYFTSFFGEIEKFRLDTEHNRRKAQLQLEGKGANLFESLFEPQLRDRLWSLRDQITSIHILSDEPWIPWELCKLGGRDEDDRYVDGPFLGQAFAVTRWLREIKTVPRLSMNNVALVKAGDSGLSYAVAEAASIKALATTQRLVSEIPSDFVAVVDGFTSGAYDCWHFTGHGAFNPAAPDRSAIYLSAHDEMTPQTISGKVTNLGRSSPLVFFNACQVGRGAMSLTRMGGWARQFLHAGAGAFIGTHWSVYDEPAHTFARTLYRELTAGTPIGTAARKARVAINRDGDPTWMAYTVFADPYATVS